MISKLQKIIDMIPTGEDHAVSMPSLARALDVSEREVRQIVLRARMAGGIIAGTASGYFIPDSDEELLAYYRMAEARSLTTLASLKATRHELKRRGISPAEISRKRTSKDHLSDDYTTGGGEGDE